MKESYKSETVLNRARELLPHAEKIQVDSFLPGGWSNRNYRIRADGVHAVLRIKNAKSAKPGTEPNYLAINRAPEVLAYDSATGDMVTKWVDGPLLVESPISAETAADYMLDLHEAIPRGIRKYNVHLAISEYLAEEPLIEPLRTIYEELDWRPQSLCGCHNELNDWNVIKTDSGFCTLDWESAGDNDPIFDLVGLCYGLEFSDLEFEQCVVRYRADVDLEFVRRTRMIYQIREHAWATDRLSMGNRKPEIKQQYDDTVNEVLRLSQPKKNSDIG